MQQNTQPRRPVLSQLRMGNPRCYMLMVQKSGDRLGCIKPSTYWDKLPNLNWFAGFLPSTVPFFDWPDKNKTLGPHLTSNRRPSAGHIGGVHPPITETNTPPFCALFWALSLHCCTAFKSWSSTVQVAMECWKIKGWRNATPLFRGVQKVYPPQKLDG